ncbi:SDR family oxidoreductase [Ralstonia insidiosa]|mgnify:CR=1 FL=1|jgi:nucleoside-diphosphate-sugar epimerase|uniref:SDR family oxidoreductase n=1 Tax=Ralstonia TaxID=48736 RepID=UPI0006649E83|nr:SDR family oxidoreductase [Ralstonia insidiosa]KMW44514.1 membrane protein [Ralstonia sp. MD27]MBX3773294.1 SDR family NAD(P)-dependent oxidoreductase [Ralstonia pickettii]NOZ16673.1 SDR family NAD(P)-dependent oxidoreductase [Betaproteobacteria bacterium]MBA9858395.1 SDR family NAD(P)-dependent oxidoreductase [Ralstonia insidiosa]MBA9872352.1 SDR family NAD(P)-dependent oxidoreductase [Ralstonia insidiosa]
MEQATQAKRIALVLGATGGIGGEVARRLVARGWHVRALQRNPDALTDRNTAFEWVRGDAMVREDVVGAAQGAELIVHAVNPPGYQNWAGQVLPMIDNTIAAARASGARIVLPGTVYNFAPDTFPVLRENTAQQPLTRKGKIRVELERRMQAASADGVRSLIVRAGDFFGPQTGNNWFAAALVRPGKAVGTVTVPNARGVGHQWAYLPDVAETMLRLVEQGDRLPAFAVYHMRGHWDADGTQMPRSIGHSVGRSVKTRLFPWWILPILSPFSETMREMREMRYLWQQPVRMDNAKLVQALGAEPHTPWDEAVGTTLRSLRCV